MRAIAPSLSLLLGLLLPVFAAAQTSPRPSDAVLDALRLEPLLEQMQAEAVETGRELAEQMLPGRDTGGLTATIAGLNAPGRLSPRIRDRFAAALPVAEAGDILAYFTSPLGERVVSLELSARSALQSDGLEDEVLERLDQLGRDDPDRVAMFDRYITSNELVERNVVGALNANVAFLTAIREVLSDFGTLPSDGDVYEQVSAQEPEIRETTQNWVRAFVGLAYQPLSDGELERHVDFAETEAGRALNNALFAAFDEIFEEVSASTGAALAQQMISDEL